MLYPKLAAQVPARFPPNAGFWPVNSKPLCLLSKSTQNLLTKLTKLSKPSRPANTKPLNPLVVPEILYVGRGRAIKSLLPCPLPILLG